MSAQIAAELGDGLFATEPDAGLVSSWQRLGGSGPAYDCEPSSPGQVAAAPPQPAEAAPQADALTRAGRWGMRPAGPQAPETPGLPRRAATRPRWCPR